MSILHGSHLTSLCSSSSTTRKESNSGTLNPRYALADISITSPLLPEHLTRLFLNFAAVTSNYSPAQISHGIWAMFSPSFSLMDILWDSAVPLEKRLECIRSMATLFADFVAANDAELLQKCFYMWWHIVVTGFWTHQGQFETPDLVTRS